MEDKILTIQHSTGVLEIRSLPSGKKIIKVIHCKSPFVASKSCNTSYSIELISLILETFGTEYLCDEIKRDEDSYYIERKLKRALLAFAPESFFENRRLLDFGCGGGSSTMILARLFPKTQIVGVDRFENLLSIARARCKHYKFSPSRIKFVLSPNTNMLPKELSKFDFIVLNEVYEHLLPNERISLLEQLWTLLTPSGILFVSGTPYRYYPIEAHTTGLPLINYLPDKMAFAIARRYSKQVYMNESWANLLRRGIRGATEREIMEILRKIDGTPIQVKPTRIGISDRIDLWYVPEVTGTRSTGSFISFGFAYSLYRSQLLRLVLKLVLRATGIPFVSAINVAVQKLS